MQKINYFKVLIATFLVILLILGMHGFKAADSLVLTDNEYFLASSIQAETAFEDEDFLRASGYLQPVRVVEKSPSISGQIQEVLVEEGEIVEKDMILLELDKSQAEKELEAAEKSLAREEALLAAEEAAYRQAEKSLQLAEHELAVLQDLNREVLRAEVELAAIDRDYELREFERAERLFQRDAMEEIEFDRYRYNLNRAEQNLKIQELNLEDQLEADEDSITEAELRSAEAEEALAAADKQLQAARERVAAAEVEVQQAKLQLQEHEIRSADSMVVLEKHVEAGEYASPGEPLVTLATQRQQVLIEPDEREAGDIYVGQTGEAVVEGYPDRPFSVEVKEISPRVDLERGTMEVYLDIEEEAPDMLPYMTVSVDLELEEE